MKRPRAAIVGAGLMGRWHADSAVRAGGAVTVVADVDLARAGALARRHGAVACNPDELGDGSPVDVAHVCTPLNTHAAVAGALLRAGIPTLIEKPLARDPEETEALLRLASERGVPVCAVHQFPFQAGFRRTLADRDALGALLHVDYVASTAGGVGRPALELESIVADILPHPISLLCRLLPGPMHALPWATARPAPGEFRAQASAGGTSIGLLVSLSGRPTRNTLRLVGSKASAHVDLFHGFATREPGHVSRLRKATRPFTYSGATLVAAAANLGARALRREPAYPGLRALVQAFYRTLAEGGPPPVSAEEMRDVARTRALLASGGF